MAKILEKEIHYGESLSVTLKVYRELRNSWRISLGKNGAILRIPGYYTNKDLESKIEWSKDWIYQQLSSKPNLKSNFTHSLFKTGDTLNIIGKQYILIFHQNDSAKRLSARIQDNQIIINSPVLPEKAWIRSVASLLSKVAAKVSATYIHRRIDDINDRFFQKEIGKISFKYNTSNWGSCSTKSNINLSTRLMLAPVEVIDYVIVHELCHLVHMNHSPSFWALVEKIMPGYKQHEKWLQKNSHLCDFKPIQ